MKSVNFKIGGFRIRYLVGAIIGALYLLGYFYPRELWFTSSVIYSPLGVQIVFWGLFCLLLFDEVLGLADKALGGVGELLFEKIRPSFRAIFLLIFGAVFIYIFRARHFIWGDAHVIVRYIEEFSTGGGSVTRRYFIELFFSTFVKALSPLGLDTYTILMLLHSVLGGVFLWLTAKFGEHFGRNTKERAGIFLITASSGLFLMFTHLELYAPGLVCGAWFLLSFLKNLHSKGFARYAFILPLALAIMLQPLYIYLLIIVPMILVKRLDKRITGLAMIIVSVGALCFIGTGLDEATKHSCLPMSFPNYFLSKHHLWLLVNLILFATPAVFILPLEFKKRPGEEIQYLSALAIASVALIIPLFLELGALDWDLTMTLLFPLVFIAAIKTVRKRPELRAFIVGIALLVCSTEMYLNIDNYRGEKRAENILLMQRTPYYFFSRSPLDRLVMTNIYQPEKFWNPYKVTLWGDRLIEVQPHYARPYLYMMSFNLWTDRKSRAASYAFQAIHSGKVGEDMIPRLMRFFEESLVREVPSYDEVERMFNDGGPFSLDLELIRELQELALTDKMPSPNRERSLEEILRITLYMNQMAVAGNFEVVDAVHRAGKKIYPKSANIELVYGAILLMDKRPVEANDALRNAFELKGDIGSIFSNLGLVCAMMNDVDRGLAVVNKAVEARPWLANYRCNYALLLNEKFGPDSAYSYLQNYGMMAERGGYPTEAAVAWEFMQSLKSAETPSYALPEHSGGD